VIIESAFFPKDENITYTKIVPYANPVEMKYLISGKRPYSRVKVALAATTRPVKVYWNPSNRPVRMLMRLDGRLG